ncbi:MAG: glycosyltransferase, partial [Planctomycetota bacterium]
MMNNCTNKTDKLRLLYIIGRYPNLTTTFIDREITLLRQWGVSLHIVSIRRPFGTLSADQEGLKDGVIYLLPVSLIFFIVGHLRLLLLHPVRYFGTLFYLLTRPHPAMVTRMKTLFHFGEAVYAAHNLRHQVYHHIHAHFVDRATIVALIVSRLLNVPYSTTAHANDIYVSPVLLSEKMAEAKFVVTCTNYNKNYLSNNCGADLSDKLHCIYHGLNLEKYKPQPRSARQKPVLLSVGQLREKKGFGYLLEACRILKERGYDFDCQIVGEGPLRNALGAQIQQLSLKDTVTLC